MPQTREDRRIIAAFLLVLAVCLFCADRERVQAVPGVIGYLVQSHEVEFYHVQDR